METVEDEDDSSLKNMNIAPRNKRRLLELSDGSDDDEFPSNAIVSF